ncbi:MAG: hypothetical protein K2K16_10715 [Ruminococcus sp.]|nr:hypothetical protein [Ruminococcus sp.]
MTENEYREKMKVLGWKDENIENFVKIHNFHQSQCKIDIPFEIYLISCPQISRYPSEGDTY